jgi:hypothetical protein
VDHAIQLIGGFGVGDPRLLGQPFGDFRFPHADSILTGQILQFLIGGVPGIANIL